MHKKNSFSNSIGQQFLFTCIANMVIDNSQTVGHICIVKVTPFQSSNTIKQPSGDKWELIGAVKVFV
jgi:hypothetical protein